MSKPLLLLAIDACDPALFERGEAGVPRIVDLLRTHQAAEGVDYAPPLILCRPEDAARARGALLVTEDSDGTVIALAGSGNPAQRNTLAIHYGVRHHPGGMLVDALLQIATGLWPLPNGEAPISFLPSGQKGVLTPDTEIWGRWLERHT